MRRKTLAPVDSRVETCKRLGNDKRDPVYSLVGAHRRGVEAAEALILSVSSSSGSTQTRSL